MSARPIAQGKMYHVTGMGIDLIVMCGHACDALILCSKFIKETENE